MLAAIFLSSVALLILSTGLLFAPFGARSGPASRLLAFATSVVAGLAAWALSTALGSPRPTATGVGVVIALAGVAWLPLTRRWNARGHLAWTFMTVSGAAHLAYSAAWTLRSDLGGVGTAAAFVLIALEAAAFAVGCMYGRELVDVVARRQWRRRCPAGAVGVPARVPFVSLHVPAYNEPPDMIIATLRSLLALDYPAYEIVMLDDNTTSQALWRPVQAFCEAHGIRFHHLQDWPGFKSGALNFALTVTDPRAEVVGVIDADYLVRPDYLRRCAPLFADEQLAFVQTPQDYREWAHAPYYRRLYYSYEYFFRVSQVSRNERGGAIFGGTMGLIRRAALEAVGGWDEWCITEDAELSLRLLRAGYTGQHVETPFGRGIMPLTFEALKRQRFRWCFGGVQILRKHWRSLMPWDRTPGNQLALRQRYDYLAGALQWFGDLLAMGFAALLLVGTLNLTLGNGLLFRRLSGALLVVPPMLLGLGIVRSVGLIQRRTGATWRDAAGALTVWLALGLTVARACAQAMLQPDGVFLRTPKTKGDATWGDALRGNKTETALGLLLVAMLPLVALRSGALTAAVLGALLAWHAGAFLLAPAQSLAAQRADLSPQLRSMRRTEWIRDRRTTTRTVLRVGLTGVILVGATAIAWMFLAPRPPASGPTGDLLTESLGRAPVSTASPTDETTTTVPSTETGGEPAQPPSSTAVPTTSGDSASIDRIDVATTGSNQPATTAPPTTRRGNGRGPSTTVAPSTTGGGPSSTTPTSKPGRTPSTPSTPPHP